MDRVITQRSFKHSLEKLTTIDYLTNDQMSFVDVNLIKQLKDNKGQPWGPAHVVNDSVGFYVCILYWYKCRMTRIFLKQT